MWLGAAPATWANLAGRFLPEKRPVWRAAASAPWALWVIYTWLRFRDEPSGLAAAVAFVLSLPLIKAYYILFRYEDFRAFALKFAALDASILRVIGLVYVGFAAALLGIAFSV
jgi:hypothetical protein